MIARIASEVIGIIFLLAMIPSLLGFIISMMPKIPADIFAVGFPDVSRCNKLQKRIGNFTVSYLGHLNLRFQAHATIVLFS